jgi:hypothetical protein
MGTSLINIDIVATAVNATKVCVCVCRATPAADRTGSVCPVGGASKRSAARARHNVFTLCDSHLLLVWVCRRPSVFLCAPIQMPFDLDLLCVVVCRAYP